MVSCCSRYSDCCISNSRSSLLWIWNFITYTKHKMRHKVTFISKNDLVELQTIYNIVSNTPLIINGVFNSKNADKSWNILQDFFIKLSEKYRYDWNQCKICSDGTVVTITKRESKKRLKSPKLFLKEEFTRN